jgi:hypothetical protein
MSEGCRKLSCRRRATRRRAVGIKFRNASTGGESRSWDGSQPGAMPAASETWLLTFPKHGHKEMLPQPCTLHLRGSATVTPVYTRWDLARMTDDEFVKFPPGTVVLEPPGSVYDDAVLIYIGCFESIHSGHGGKLDALDCYVERTQIDVVNEVLGGPEKYRMRATQETFREPRPSAYTNDYVQVALEIISIVSNVGGSAVVAIAAWKATSKVHKRIFERTGRQALISLGAAGHLAAADFCMRLGRECDINIFGKGAVKYGRDPIFWIALAGSKRHSAFYFVDVVGNCTLVGMAEIPQSKRQAPFDSFLGLHLGNPPSGNA